MTQMTASRARCRLLRETMCGFSYTATRLRVNGTQLTGSQTYASGKRLSLDDLIADINKDRRTNMDGQVYPP